MRKFMKTLDGFPLTRYFRCPSKLQSQMTPISTHMVKSWISKGIEEKRSSNFLKSGITDLQDKYCKSCQKLTRPGK